jgi:hypothetical protein
MWVAVAEVQAALAAIVILVLSQQVAAAAVAGGMALWVVQADRVVAAAQHQLTVVD